MSVEALVEGAAAAGLNGLALTDHDSVAGHAELAALRTRFPAMVLIPGVEISTREGHLLAYGVNEAPPRGRPIAETVEWIRARQGVSAVSHPFRRVHGVGGSVAESVRADAIEAVNGHNSPRANRKAVHLVTRRRIAATGGGDVHEPVDVGKAWTEFPDSVLDVPTALEAIRLAQTTATGESLVGLRRIRYELRTFALRARRGFRPV